MPRPVPCRGGAPRPRKARNVRFRPKLVNAPSRCGESVLSVCGGAPLDHMAPAPLLFDCMPGCTPSCISGCTPMFLFRTSAYDERIDSDEALECAVCLSLLIEPIKFPGCSHSFCRLCLLRLQMHAAFRCPLCRCHSSLTISELSKWPVSRELRSRAKAAAPALYEKRSQDHSLRIVSLLHEHAAKRMQDKCPYREYLPMRFTGTYIPPRFTPVDDCLDAVIRCLGRRWR